MSKASLRQFAAEYFECMLLNIEDNFDDKVFLNVIEDVEFSLLESTMLYVEGNQSRAALMLSMSRATLRKKLAKYGLLHHGK